MLAPSSSTKPRAHRLTFTATAWEYFRVWLPGACLNWLTLGVYSAWASVRRRRYLLSHTELDGLPFGYEARPWPLFVWRASLLVMVGVAWLGLALRYVGPLVFLVYAFLLPGVLVRLARFLAHAHTYRGAPGEFDGTSRSFACIRQPALICAMLSVFPPLAELLQLSRPLTWSVVTSALHCVVCALMLVVVETSCRNAVARHTYWDGVSFDSRLEPNSMAWLRLTNIVASWLSLGLLIPWAEIRSRRYYLSRVRVLAS